MAASRLLALAAMTLILAFAGRLVPGVSPPAPMPVIYAPEKQVPAFPGAVGGGMYTSGGRGGRVVKVTNLNDDGPGSLRRAIASPGRRTILFDTSGTIVLRSPVIVEHGDLTIAGQSAPGDGICLKGHEMRIAADNVIIRFMRFRPGDISGNEYDAITGTGNRNIIIDHCSMSWSTDETVSFYDNEDFTLQWCMISESLHYSVHSKGPHGYGGIWGGKNASFLFNILAHHQSRNPRLQGARYNPVDGEERTELVGNIIYNWGSKAIYGGENGCYNIINNVFIPGPATHANSREEILDPYEPYGKFFLLGNHVIGSDGVSGETWDGVNVTGKGMEVLREVSAFPFATDYLIFSPEELCGNVLALAGASLNRDAADARIIREIRERSFSFGNFGIIDSQADTNGWPVLAALPARTDSDGDGIPDAWELQNGLNPLDPSDGNAYTLNPGYTNLEVYLNELVEDIINKRINHCSLK